ncbi:hypothetical protein ASF61_03930 [Duganella sp. Leaf126]|uniref:flavin-containing monooxygenase n=1 Tax=Duganella sp. Leaf126 TaxID=1736266 RepID=UPI0006F90D47|nr:NAD(P)/FAD-dependent oxidoreductase [Duganella sp. Leaf126]KQQ39970.1 hypothetical protein ASF61_03930 [Duganella sp. Leaf126]
MEHDQIIDCGNAVCVVGAGPGGLSAARALKGMQLAYEQFERHSDVGGIWDMHNPGSPIYQSAHFISSRDLSGFIGFPMPKSYPDYPTNQQILAYVRSYADAYGLRAAIRFNTPVQHVQKQDDGRWLVTLGDGSRRRYLAVICATGCNWDANMPAIKGQFNGEIRHSVTYKQADEFAGKRVMIVGAGNSGADIACDAATRAGKAFISMRRGYHFIPKHLFGLPADQVGESGPQLPLWIARPVMSVLLKMFTGDLTRFGLPKPDHRLFESHPLLNSQLLHHLQHGNIAVRPDIAHYDGDDVVFVDGSREKLDLVVYATGYKWSCKYAADYFEWRGGRPQLYLSMFSREHRNLFGIGYVETNSSAYKLFDTEAFMIACYLRDQVKQLGAARRFDALIANDNPDLSGGLKFVQSQRHEVYLEAHALKSYLKRLRKRMGWPELTDTFYDHLRQQPGAATAHAPASLRAAA